MAAYSIAVACGLALLGVGFSANAALESSALARFLGARAPKPPAAETVRGHLGVIGLNAVAGFLAWQGAWAVLLSALGR